MSRTGVLPEADFYCPIPYESLTIVTAAAIEQEIAAGSQGLLNRIFRLIVAELEVADPAWCQSIALNTLDADSFATAWFAERKSHDPFLWAEANLQEVERNKRQKYTVPWRYTICGYTRWFRKSSLTLMRKTVKGLVRGSRGYL